MGQIPEYDRRQKERRSTPPMACETICKPVDDKLDSIWEGVKARPTNRIFFLILGGFGVLLMALLYFLWAMKGEITTATTQTVVLTGEVKVVQSQLVSNATSLTTFVSMLDRENARQDSRIQRMEDKIETFYRPGGK